MSIEDLLREHRIHRHQASEDDLRALADRAEADLASAVYMLDQDPDWALSIAYNAVLRSARALVFSKGYRPASHEGHKNTFAFLRVVASEEERPRIAYFDRVRVKRHQALYDAEPRTSKTEAEALIRHARDFLTWMRKEIGL